MATTLSWPLSRGDTSCSELFTEEVEHQHTPDTSVPIPGLAGQPHSWGLVAVLGRSGRGGWVWGGGSGALMRGGETRVAAVT